MNYLLLGTCSDIRAIHFFRPCKLKAALIGGLVMARRGREACLLIPRAQAARGEFLEGLIVAYQMRFFDSFPIFGMEYTYCRAFQIFNLIQAISYGVCDRPFNEFVV